MTTRHIDIKIVGPAGAGKSYLLNLIGTLLKERGHNVNCFDEETIEIDPSLPTKLANDTVINLIVSEK